MRLIAQLHPLQHKIFPRRCKSKCLTAAMGIEQVGGAPHEVAEEWDEDGREAGECHVAASHDRARHYRPIRQPVLARRQPALRRLKYWLRKHLRAHTVFNAFPGST